MKITLNQPKLNKALTGAERIVSKNPSLPILNNILLRTENGMLKVSATNLEIGINYYIGSKIDELGEISVPAKILTGFINGIKDEKVTLISKNKTLLINTDSYKTQILGSDPKDFPLIPKIKEAPFTTISAKVFKNALISVADAIAVSESRPELAGVYMQFNNSNLVCAATDSFRLAEKISSIKNKDTIAIILPRNTVVELIRALGDYSGDIAIRFKDNQVSFLSDEWEIISRLVDGNYPDYKKIIPEKFISQITVKKGELEKNVRLAGIFSSNIADIKLYCDKKSLIISSKNPEKGEIQTAVDAVLKNDPFDISLNHYYFLDGLKVIPTDNIVIEYTGQGSPLVLRPESDDKSLTYLIMPLKR